MNLAERFAQAKQLQSAGQIDLAEEVYAQIIAADPTSAAALNQLAVIAFQRGESVRALDLLEWAVASKPDYAEAHYRRGMVNYALGRLEACIASYGAVLAIRADITGAVFNRGIALQDLGRFDLALADYDAALKLEPAHVGALANRGYVLANLNRADEAIANLDLAVQLAPDHFEARVNRGYALERLNRFGPALAEFDAALRLRPASAEAHINRGVVFQRRGDLDAALATFDAALAFEPANVGARYNKGVTLLLKGELEAGWPLYESRWDLPGSPGRRTCPQPVWSGDVVLMGRTILLHAEQGYGDTLQFCRYASLIGEGATVVLEVQPPLARLMTTAPGVAQVVARGDASPAFDVHCPLMSLPLALRTCLATIPAVTPYLTADPADRTRWRERLAPVHGLRVGLVWAGNSYRDQLASAVFDARRSVSLAALAPLGAVAGVSFVSLQKAGPAVQAPPPGLELYDFTDELNDFADTAALIEALDLVISVDTAVAHLAGALAKPVWLLNRFDPDWRWLLDRDDSPWYPTLRQFRQPRYGDWESVIEQVVEALRRLAAGDRGELQPRSARSRRRGRAAEQTS